MCSKTLIVFTHSLKSHTLSSRSSFASSARECASSALTVALSSRISVTVPSEESFKSISRWVARASMKIERISAEKGESDRSPPR